MQIGFYPQCIRARHTEKDTTVSRNFRWIDAIALGFYCVGLGETNVDPVKLPAIRLKKTWGPFKGTTPENTIIGMLQMHSSSTDQYKGGDDYFYLPKGFQIRSGHWGLRNFDQLAKWLNALDVTIANATTPPNTKLEILIGNRAKVDTILTNYQTLVRRNPQPPPT
jgi:hypothetical protein